MVGEGGYTDNSETQIIQSCRLSSHEQTINYKGKEKDKGKGKGKGKDKGKGKGHPITGHEGTEGK
jgi:hypothetical protein